MIMIKEVTRFVTKFDADLISFHRVQKTKVTAMAIIGKTHAITILINAGCVESPLSLTKQSIDRIISLLFPINEMTSRNCFKLSSQLRSNDYAKVRIWK